MKTRDRKTYMQTYLKNRRAVLKAKGICPDCQTERAAPGHVCCIFCLKDRRDRGRVNRMILPLPFPEQLEQTA